MPPLQVRDLPQDIYEPFRRIAEREHRSLAQQTIVALEYYLEHHELKGGKVVEKGLGAPTAFVPFERDGITYMVDPNETPAQCASRLEALFSKVDKLPAIDTPDSFPDVVGIIREGRESRTERIVKAVEEGPWQ